MDVSYVAGFFDGEGHVSCYQLKGRPAYRFSLGMGQKVPAMKVLEDIRLFLWTSHGIRSAIYISKRTTGRNSRQANLSITSARHTLNFLVLVRPHLIVKADKADAAIPLLTAAIGRAEDLVARRQAADQAKPA